MADLDYGYRERQIRTAMEKYWGCWGCDDADQDIYGMKQEVWESIRSMPESWQRTADFLRETKQKASIADVWQKKANALQMEQALSGKAEGQFQTGLSYTCGSGLEADPGTGFYWFLRAAFGKKKGAKEVLADFCRTGTAFPQDIRLAEGLEAAGELPAWQGSEEEQRLDALIAEREELLLQEEVLRGKLDFKEFSKPQESKELRKQKTKVSKIKKPAKKTDDDSGIKDKLLSWVYFLAPIVMIGLTIFTVAEYSGDAAETAPFWLRFIISLFYYIPAQILFQAPGSLDAVFQEIANAGAGFIGLAIIDLLWTYIFLFLVSLPFRALRHMGSSAVDNSQNRQTRQLHVMEQEYEKLTKSQCMESFETQIKEHQRKTAAGCAQLHSQAAKKDEEIGNLLQQAGFPARLRDAGFFAVAKLKAAMEGSSLTKAVGEMEENREYVLKEVSFSGAEPRLYGPLLLPLLSILIPGEEEAPYPVSGAALKNRRLGQILEKTCCYKRAYRAYCAAAEAGDPESMWFASNLAINYLSENAPYYVQFLRFGRFQSRDSFQAARRTTGSEAESIVKEGAAWWTKSVARRSIWEAAYYKPQAALALAKQGEAAGFLYLGRFVAALGLDPSLSFQCAMARWKVRYRIGDMDAALMAEPKSRLAGKHLYFKLEDFYSRVRADGENQIKYYEKKISRISTIAELTGYGPAKVAVRDYEGYLKDAKEELARQQDRERQAEREHSRRIQEQYQSAVRAAEEAFDESADAQERTINALFGCGVMTDEELHAAGLLSHSTYDTSAMFRDRKRDKFVEEQLKQ